MLLLMKEKDGEQFMKDMISVASDFQYSVNIGYDLGNDNKLVDFIPLKSALNLLEEILLSINPSSSNRARVLIGAYGKGKSHIMLMILSILMKRDLQLFKKLMPKIQEYPKLNKLVHSYYEGKDKILPVVVTGSNTSLTQAFLLALQRTLSEFGLIDIMPETNYMAAVNVIHRWQKDYPDVYSKFTDIINEPTHVFIEKLENFNIVAYETFEKNYPKLSAGSVFNPFLGFDVVELYECVANSLKEKGYTGIYVVYDEFSKFLESNITDASVSDTKMLQDFAEKCARSRELQLHIMLISHKEISNYIDKLPKEKTDGWRGVSERFRHIHMNNSFTQAYEIISSVIQHKEPEWSKFCKKHNINFNSLLDCYSEHPMFKDAHEEINTIVNGCFPLHPVSTYILPRLSERVAQNERTLFTFLSAEGPATLSSFLSRFDNNFTLVTPDLIFDYFEPLLKKEIYAGEVHNTFVLTSMILNQISEESLAKKIIKTISLIYILEEFERLAPTKDQIISIYSGSYSISDIIRAIDDLIEQEHVVYLRRSNNYLRLKQTSGVDIRQRINNLKESQSRKIVPKDVLNSSNFDNYIYPSRYNDNREMTRFFSFLFVDGEEIGLDTDWNVKSETIHADGFVYGIIPKSEEELQRLPEILKSSSKGLTRHIFVIPKQFRAIHDVTQEYAAVSQLKDHSVDDPVLFEEYEVVFDDLQEIIKEFISTYTQPERFLSNYIYDGEILDVCRKSELTELMSKICDSVYALTPVINNESVNKNEITSIAANNRNKIISALLRVELEPNLGLSGSGQEVSIMRSTLLRTGIWNEDGGVPKINLRPNDTNMRNMLETIESFILKARRVGRINFSELYEKLTSPKYRIGLRYGIIPIYLAAVMHNYRQHILIQDRFGAMQISSDTLVLINSEPENYTLEYLDWDPEKEKYVSMLASAFADYVVEAEKLGNTYEFAVNAMRRWYMALPKYSKELTILPSGEKISKQQLGMLKLLHDNVNSSDLLFTKLPEVFGYQVFSSEVALNVIAAKNLFDGLLGELKQYLILKTQKVFLPEEDNEVGNCSSLIATVKEWCNSLDSTSFEQLFPDGTDRFLQFLRNATNDEELFITNLAKITTGLRIEDWNNKTSDLFFNTLKQFIKTAKEFHSNVIAETINKTFSYQITFADEKGQQTNRRFDRVEVSSRGKLLFNQITASLEAMGHSISEAEKRQILMEVLKKLC